MPKVMIEDETFGSLLWDPNMGRWGCAVALPYFRECGTRILRFESERIEENTEGADALQKLKGSTSTEFVERMLAIAGLNPTERMFDNMREIAEHMDRDDPLKPALLFRRGLFKLTIATAEKYDLPTSSQRAAWRGLMAGGDLVFDRVLSRVLEVYQRQRTARIHWRQQIYGDDNSVLDQVLPAFIEAGTLYSMVQPIEIYIHKDAPDSQKGVPCIGIHFDCAWNRGGLSVLLCDGEVIDVGDREFAMESRREDPIVEHAVFGRMTQSTYEWVGFFRWDALRAFHEIVHDRQTFLRYHKGTNTRAFDPPWDFLEGRFDLNVPVEADAEPSAAQVEAFRSFTADLNQSASQVLLAILKYYQNVFEIYRKGFGDDEMRDILIPQINSVEELKHLITFHSILVYLKGEPDDVAIGLGFHCSWEQEHGLGVRWRNGVIEEIGTGEVAYR